MAGKGQSLLDADGVGGRKNKLVFTGKRPACGDPHAQELTAAIHFEQFTRATEELLLKGGAKPRGSRKRHRIRGQTDGLRAQREYGGATRVIRGPCYGPAPGHAVKNLSTQSIGLPDEPSGVRRGGMRV